MGQAGCPALVVKHGCSLGRVALCHRSSTMGNFWYVTERHKFYKKSFCVFICKGTSAPSEVLPGISDSRNGCQVTEHHLSDGLLSPAWRCWLG